MKLLILFALTLFLQAGATATGADQPGKPTMDDNYPKFDANLVFVADKSGNEAIEMLGRQSFQLYNSLLTLWEKVDANERRSRDAEKTVDQLSMDTMNSIRGILTNLVRKDTDKKLALNSVYEIKKIGGRTDFKKPLEFNLVDANDQHDHNLHTYIFDFKHGEFVRTASVPAFKSDSTANEAAISEPVKKATKSEANGNQVPPKSHEQIRGLVDMEERKKLFGHLGSSMNSQSHQSPFTFAHEKTAFPQLPPVVTVN